MLWKRRALSVAAKEPGLGSVPQHRFCAASASERERGGRETRGADPAALGAGGTGCPGPCWGLQRSRTCCRAGAGATALLSSASLGVFDKLTLSH